MEQTITVNASEVQDKYIVDEKAMENKEIHVESKIECEDFVK